MLNDERPILNDEGLMRNLKKRLLFILTHHSSLCVLPSLNPERPVFNRLRLNPLLDALDLMVDPVFFPIDPLRIPRK